MHAHSAGFSPPAVTRRSFLACIGAGFSAVVTGIHGWSCGTAGAAVSLSESGAAGHPPLHREAFAPYLGEQFTLEAENQPPVSCRLEEITGEQQNGMIPERFATFSLFFSCPREVGESRIYRISHSRMSHQEFFLSPVGASGKNRIMEAVFSRRIPV